MAAFAITALWALWGVHGPRRGLFRVGPWAGLAAALLVALGWGAAPDLRVRAMRRRCN